MFVPCVVLKSLTAFWFMPTFAIAKLFASSGPPNPGAVSEATEVPVTDH